MKRILFVDDEQAVLDGLRNLLRKQRKEWDMVFAPGGQAALDELARSRFDVVVSDMRMPGIDGVALLQKVKELHPTTARIILSGHAEREAVVAALPVSHQFLSKPCDAETLRVVVERASGLQTLLQDEAVRKVVGKVDRLPSVPRTYWELNHAASDADAGLADLAAIVEKDAAMATKVLQLVNSSYFGLAQRQTSVRQAVAYLGTELLKALALTAHVFVAGAAPTVEGFSLEGLQDHSLQAAHLAKRLLRDEKRAATAFTAALVHDLGKMLLAMSDPARFVEVLREARRSRRPASIFEKERFGVTHAEVGAYLLGLWGLPLDIVEAVAYHHRPDLVASSDILIAVHVADALVNVPDERSLDPGAGGWLNLEAVERAGYAAELPRWRKLAEDQLREMPEVGR